MDTEQLVQLITARVLEQLRQAPNGEQEIVQPAGLKVLALFTGGTIGLPEGLAAVREISGFAEVSVVLSPAAEAVIGVSRIKDSLGDQCPIITAQDRFPGKILREADLVLVPVLTLNTAGKVALALSDSLPATLIQQALLLGKPVIAASNAADPKDGWRVGSGMGQGTPALIQSLQNHLRQIEGFGMTLTDVRQLTDEVKKLQSPRVTAPREAAPAVSLPVGKNQRRFISAEEVKSAALSGQKQLVIEPGARVTPLALDIAREYGVELQMAEG